MTRSLKKLSPAEKAAVLLVSLGEDLASELLRGIAPNDARRILEATARLGTIDEHAVMQVQSEFQVLLKSFKPVLQGGRDVTQKLMTKSFGSSSPMSLSDLPGAVSPVFAEAEQVEASLIYKVLSKEAPQTASLILAHLSPKKAGEVLSFYPGPSQTDLLLRMALLSEVSQDVLNDLAETFSERLTQIRRHSSNRIGGLDKTAQILAAMNKTDRDTLLAGIAERNPSAADSISQQLWTFEDLSKLDTADLEKLVRQIPQAELEIALRRASDTLKAKIFKAMSTRKAEEMKENIALAKPVVLSKVEEAQRRIATSAQELIAKGDLKDPHIEAV